MLSIFYYGRGLRRFSLLYLIISRQNTSVSRNVRQVVTVVSGRGLRRFSLLYLISSRQHTSDSNNVARQFAAKIIDTNKTREICHPVTQVVVDRNKVTGGRLFPKEEAKLLRKKKSDPSDSPKEIAKKIIAEVPEPPTTCCQSGCANCVWLEYAEKLSKYFENGDEEAISNISKLVTDDNLKAFILHELKMREKKAS